MNNKYAVIALIICTVVAVYANSLYGEFVYDDTRQIVRNPLIQDPSLFGKALTSDVWAFKGDGSVSASNYWRPVFTALNILSFQVFGLNPVGWHALNIFLHAGVCVLAFLLLCRWGLSFALSFAISLVFAVHPVHVESVAWVAGSPDLLFGFFLLASLWFAGNYARSKNFIDLGAAIVFYALSAGSKEVALACFPIFGLIYFYQHKSDNVSDLRSASLRFVIPFAAVAGMFFVFRWMIIGQLSHSIDGTLTLEQTILTIPSVILFYLKQMVFPVSLGINYPLRPAAAGDFAGIFISLAFLAAFTVLIYRVSKQSFVQKIGAFLFVLPLLPALNLTVFVPEQFVHDRYLYLPLLGFLMIFLPHFKNYAALIPARSSEKILVIAVTVLCIPLGLKTFYQNRIWGSEVRLWENAVMIDPKSSYNWSQFGAALLEKEMNEKAVEAYDRSLDLRVSALALMGRARANLNLKRLEEAVWDLKTVTEMKDEASNSYTLYQTYEALAIAYSEQNRLADAAEVLIEARKRLPIFHAALTEKLAVVYYLSGKKDLALTELEDAKTRARAELLPESKAVFLRLGMLYAELGEKEKARDALQEYLRLTVSLQNKLTIADRKTAAELLTRLN